MLYLFIMIFLGIGFLALTGAYPHVSEGLRMRAMCYGAEQKEETVLCEEDLLKLNRLERFLLQTDHKLGLIGKGRSYLVFRSGALFLGGLLFGLMLFENVLLAGFLALCCMPASYLLLMLKTGSAVQRENEDLRNAMSIITGAYISKNDIVGAIQNYVSNRNQGRISKKISGFERFLSKDTFFSASVPGNLALLGEEYKNPYFKEWIRMLILCQKDHRLRFFALEPIIEEMADEQNFQIEKASVMKGIWTEFVVVSLVLLAIIPVLKVIHYDWYIILTGTAGGKLCVMGMILSTLIAGLCIAVWQAKHA